MCETLCFEKHNAPAAAVAWATPEQRCNCFKTACAPQNSETLPEADALVAVFICNTDFSVGFGFWSSPSLSLSLLPFLSELCGLTCVVSTSDVRSEPC